MIVNGRYIPTPKKGNTMTLDEFHKQEAAAFQAFFEETKAIYPKLTLDEWRKILVVAQSRYMGKTWHEACMQLPDHVTFGKEQIKAI